MIKVLKKTASWTIGIISFLFAFLPESFFSIKKWKIINSIIAHNKKIDYYALNVVFNHLLCFIMIWMLLVIVYAILLKIKWFVIIKGKNYIIKVEYGDLFKVKKSRRVINFDECFTTNVGNNPEDIKTTSICGQYLVKNPNLNIQELISKSNIKPESIKSKYNHKKRYKSGSIIQNGNDLLLAFAPLDKDGRAKFTSRSDYISCLSTMWEELFKYYNQQDISIPILGAGQTYIDINSGTSLTQQELLDIIILSYKLSPHKIKYPYKLRIICKKCKGFSLNNIESQ